MDTLIKTEKLYDKFPYEREFSANVISCEKCHDGYRIVLDRTLFFPEEGGQSCDIGTLGDADVTHVNIDECVCEDGIKGEIITHICSCPLDGEVHGRIDFERRFRNMQNHSAEHIVSGLVNKHYSYQNIGFHLGTSFVTMDYDGFMNDAQLREIEAAANRAVYENIPIEARYPSTCELEKMNYRSKKSIDGDVRIVTIKGYDSCACCAPHVARTGEIGLIKLLYAERYKGGCRVYLLAGNDALRDYSDKNAMIYRLGELLSVKPLEVYSAVERLLEQLENEKAAKAIAEKRLCYAYAREIPENESVESESYFRIYSSDELNADRLQTLADAAKTRRKILLLFVENPTQSDNDGRSFSFLLSCFEPSKYDVLIDIFLDFKSVFSVKGGGRPPYFRGSVTAKRETLEAYFNNHIKTI